jgi:hypothetical protein
MVSWFMATVAFDTHAYIKKLKSVGVSEEQAEVQAEALSNAFGEELVTKQYLKAEIERLELRLTVKMGALIALAVGIIATLIRLR